MDILEGLNPEQAEAARHGEGPLLVVAGAGTGKTRVIAHRIAALLAAGKAEPTQILALTFTEKAAKEMEERLYDLIGWKSFQVAVMTFHAFGAELLGRFASHTGRSTRGGLLNEAQKVLLLSQHIGQVAFEYYGPQADLLEFVEGIVSYIGELQNAGISPREYTEFVAGLRSNPGDLHPKEIDEQSDLAKLYSLYERVKADTGTYDHHDQIELPLEILDERPNVAGRLAGEYKYVLVDEYQDTNPAQDRLLRRLVGRKGNMFAVGDDDQAIYGFRGADINNILRFADHFEIGRPVVLTRNYRSGQPILDAAYRLITNNNPERLEAKLGLDKHLRAQSAAGETSFTYYDTTLDEFDGVANRIAQQLEGGAQAGEIGVCCATHAPLKGLAKLLASRGIPYAISTSASIFEQPELIGLWNLGKWLCGAASDEMIAHVLLGPLFGWKAREYRIVAEMAQAGLVSLEDALREAHTPESERVAGRLDAWRELAVEQPASRVIFEIVFGSGMADEWKGMAAGKARYVRVFEDLQKWFSQMLDFEAVASDPSLRAYFASYVKPPVLEVTDLLGDPTGVKLLTVHASKGLEFDTVYLIACTARLWAQGRPLMREVPEALRPRATAAGEHEYRRLMYVAATRAKSRLLLSCPQKSMGGTKQMVSPLVAELLGELPETSESSLQQQDIEKSWQKLQRYFPLSATQEGKPRLPFETDNGWLELSVTRLTRYDFCPFEFYLETVLQLPQPFGPQLAFGNVLHRVFETYNKGMISGLEADPEELHSVLDELWSDRGYESKELAQLDRQIAHSTLDKFLASPERSSAKVLAAEQKFRLDLPEPKLRLVGKIDLVAQTPEGVQLIDYKTGRTKYQTEKLNSEAKQSFQLRTYALAYSELNERPAASVKLDYVVTGGVGRAELTPLILKNHQVKLAALAGRIRARDFAPNTSAWHRCAAVRYYGTGELDEILDEAMMNRVVDE
jgi:DNA helicase-2/ATP-dependent DNA helicase PcrA